MVISLAEIHKADIISKGLRLLLNLFSLLICEQEDNEKLVTLELT